MPEKMTITEPEIKQILERHLRRFISGAQFRRDATGRAVIDVEFKTGENKEPKKPAPN